MLNFRLISVGFLLLSSTSLTSLFAQSNRVQEIITQRGEVVLKFIKPDYLSLNQLTHLMSIVGIKSDTITAYFNARQLSYFESLNISYSVIEPLKQEKAELAGSIWEWNKYPIYEEYIAMMDSFKNYNPQACKIINIGYSKYNRKILFARINTDTTKTKPSVMYSSTMHGNETGGYILMLKLIYYLLTNYGKDALVTNLVDSLDIWINPLANPDGTYFGSSVFSATRLNANNVDLNRNYPDPKGLEIDYPEVQPETQVMINLMKRRHFVLSANFHSGSEVVNYPWDRDSAFHVDKNWFEYISNEYADSAQIYGRSGYFTDVRSNGVVDGAWWYEIYGGRQDYITYLYQGREVTVELDANYVTPESNLQNLWNYNYRSLLHYLEQAKYGIHGFVLNTFTQNPVKAKIELVNHDDDNSFVFSDSLTGAFYRPVYEGNHDMLVSAAGYFPQTIKNVAIINRKTTYLNILLEPDGKSYLGNSSISCISVYPNPCKDFITIEKNTSTNPVTKFELVDLQGHVLQNITIEYFKTTIELNRVKPGIYLIRGVSGSEIFITRICKIE
jgi:hypothetical protein